MAGIAPMVYVNGDYVDLHAACLPITDRGLLFGDSVYEVVPAYRGRLFRPIQHIERLDRSLAAIRMTNPLDHQTWLAILQKLADQGPDSDQQIYLQVTRGAYSIRKHAIPDMVAPNVFVFTYLTPDPNPAMSNREIAAITLDDIRWQRCNIKSTNLLPNVLAHSQAQDEGADEAILVRDGNAIEGTASNLFIVSDGLIITPPRGDYLLPGITRDLVLELAKNNNAPHAEANIGIKELASADEVWLTSSTREIMPVVKLNGRQVGNGAAGPVWQRFDALYAACKRRLREQGDCGG